MIQANPDTVRVGDTFDYQGQPYRLWLNFPCASQAHPFPSSATASCRRGN
jgi:hypothetical protein